MILITLFLFLIGGGGGLGKQLAIQFAENGARVVLWDIDLGKKAFEFQITPFLCNLNVPNFAPGSFVESV